MDRIEIDLEDDRIHEIDYNEEDKLGQIKKYLDKHEGVRLDTKEKKAELIDLLDLRDGRNRLLKRLSVLDSYLTEYCGYTLRSGEYKILYLYCMYFLVDYTDFVSIKNK